MTSTALDPTPKPTTTYFSSIYSYFYKKKSNPEKQEEIYCKCENQVSFENDSITSFVIEHKCPSKQENTMDELDGVEEETQENTEEDIDDVLEETEESKRFIERLNMTQSICNLIDLYNIKVSMFCINLKNRAIDVLQTRYPLYQLIFMQLFIMCVFGKVDLYEQWNI